jgi:hypothetical protein
MKRNFPVIVLFLCLFAIPARSEIKTWITKGGGGNVTNTVSANQVLEVLTIALDTGTVLDVSTDGQTVTLGGGNLMVPAPFIVAGPATLVIRRSGASTQGNLITVRISSKEPARNQ